MADWWIYLIGLTAQLLFSSRLLFQWIASERKRQVVVPGSFWTQSFAASVLLFTYGYLRMDFAIMMGQSITYFIYIRNLHIQGDWMKIPKWLRMVVLIFPLLVVFYYFNNDRPDLHALLNPGNIQPWLLSLGIAGQLLFTFRFVLQWIHAEKVKRAELPPVFWYWSFLGSALIIIYAIFRLDPVLLIGQLFGFVVYARNIILGRQHAE